MLKRVGVHVFLLNAETSPAQSGTRLHGDFARVELNRRSCISSWAFRYNYHGHQRFLGTVQKRGRRRKAQLVNPPAPTLGVLLSFSKKKR